MSRFTHSGLKIAVVCCSLVVIFFSITLLQAQERASGKSEARKPSRQVATPKVKVFKVSPSQRMAAILPANSRVPDPPEPISPAVKGNILDSMGGGGGGVGSAGGFEAAPEPVLDHIVLTSKTPFVHEKGYMSLTLPYTFHPESAIVFNKNFPNVMNVKLKVEKGGVYLVDFAVDAISTGTYRVETEAGDQEFNDPGGNMEHILVGLNAGASGWTSVRLQREGTGYNLFSVEITRAN